jgi:uncharacterized MAPEG superfamily protein
MEFTALIILIALSQYLYYVFRVGTGRVRYKVHAPSTSGHDTRERMYRVQQNTMEQLVVFIPAMIIFSAYLSDRWALLPGALFILARQLYYFQYVRDPASRTLGIVLTIMANSVLVAGALVAVLIRML